MTSSLRVVCLNGHDSLWASSREPYYLLSHTLDEDHEHWGLPKTWPNRPLWRRVDRVCLRPLSLATRCLVQWTHTEQTWHNIGLGAFESYRKHTHTALGEAIIARRLDRVCSVKCMKFANEMPSASLMAWTHWIDMAQYGKVPDRGVVHFFAPGFLYHSADVKKNKKT